MLVKNTLIALLAAAPALAIPIATAEKKAIASQKNGAPHEVTKIAVSSADVQAPHDKAVVTKYGQLERRATKEEKAAAKKQKEASKKMAKEAKKMARAKAKEEKAAKKRAKEQAKKDKAASRNKRSLRINTDGLSKHADLASAGPPTGHALSSDHHSAGLPTGDSLNSPVSPLTSGSGSSLKPFPGTPSDVGTPLSASSSVHPELHTRGISEKKKANLRKGASKKGVVNEDRARAREAAHLRMKKKQREYKAKKAADAAGGAGNAKRSLEYERLERRVQGISAKKERNLRKGASHKGVVNEDRARRRMEAHARMQIKKKTYKAKKKAAGNAKRDLSINTSGLSKRADLASPVLSTTPHKAHKHTVSEKLQLNAMLLEAEHLVNGLEEQMNKEPTTFPHLKHANKLRNLHKIKLASPKTPLTPSTHTKAT